MSPAAAAACAKSSTAVSISRGLGGSTRWHNSVTTRCNDGRKKVSPTITVSSLVIRVMLSASCALNERNGPPIRYWRLGTRLGDGPFIWPAMRDGSYAAIGWDALGDLSAIAAGDHVREAVRSLLEQEYPGDARTLSRKAGEIRCTAPRRGRANSRRAS